MSVDSPIKQFVRNTPLDDILDPCKVKSWELYLTRALVNPLARKYAEADFAGGHAGQKRYKVIIEVDSWTGHG